MIEEPGERSEEPDELEPADSAREVAGEATDEADEFTANVVGVVVEQLVERVEQFRGPVPSPRHLREYEEVLPGCADRLISLTEQQSAHRREMEKEIVKTDVKLRSRGQLFAFVLGLAGIIGAIVLAAIGSDLVGFGVFLGSLATLIGVFVAQRKKEDEPSQSGVAQRPRQNPQGS